MEEQMNFFNKNLYSLIIKFIYISKNYVSTFNN